MSDIQTVLWAKKVEKQLANLPDFIVLKFYLWVATVQKNGILETRTLPGFHDEPLKGSRRGQRSIRLNKAYRAIYIETSDGVIEFLEVIEVNKHDY